MTERIWAAGGLGSAETAAARLLARLLVDGIRELRTAFVAVAIFACAGFLLHVTGLHPHRWPAWFYWPTLLFYLGIWLYGILVVVVVRRLRLRQANRNRQSDASGWVGALTDPGSFLTRAASSAAALLLVSATMNVFGAWKLSIADSGGFRLEEQVAAWNSWLHGGMREWFFATALPGGILWLLDKAYFLWLGLVALGVSVHAWRAPSASRRRFFLTFTLAWLVLGGIVATLFASAGPIFFSRIVGGVDPYAQLWAALEQAHAAYGLFTIEVQEQLWGAHIAVSINPFEAISAFPSMHVAIPVLLALSLRDTSRLLSTVFAAYSVVVLVATVALGWHYAIDGYASAVGVTILWAACGRLLSRRSTDQLADAEQRR